jgi:hypothetical protein
MRIISTTKTYNEMRKESNNNPKNERIKDSRNGSSFYEVLIKQIEKNNKYEKLNKYHE